jgi:hypothetical protein
MLINNGRGILNWDRERQYVTTTITTSYKNNHNNQISIEMQGTVSAKLH